MGRFRDDPGHSGTVGKPMLDVTTSATDNTAYQQANITVYIYIFILLFFICYRPDALPVTQPTVSNQLKPPKGKFITFHGIAYPKLTWGGGVFQYCFLPQCIYFLYI